MRKRYAGTNMVYSRAESVLILEHYFQSKWFAAVREAFSNAYPDKAVPNKTTIHRLVTTFWDTGSVCNRKHVRRRTLLTGERDCGHRHVGPRPTLRTQELLYCKSPLVRALLGAASGHRDLQTLPRQTSVGFLKERVYSKLGGSETQYRRPPTCDPTLLCPFLK
jgi:hypothetical protein